MKDVVRKKGEVTAGILKTQASDSHHSVNNWEWQLIVAAGEVALGPVSVLIDNSGIDAYSPIKLMRESDYGG